MIVSTESTAKAAVFCRSISNVPAVLGAAQFESNPPVTYKHGGEDGHGVKIYSIVIPAAVVGAVLLATILLSCCCRGSFRTLYLTRGLGAINTICREERPVLWDVYLRYNTHTRVAWEDIQVGLSC